MSEIERILDDLPSQLRHQGELEELKDYARFLEQQNKRYREAFHGIRRIDNDPFVNYCEFASLVKDIVDESLNND